MNFRPDILIGSADGFELTLVAETKLRIRDLRTVEEQLKNYMVAMNVPIGLLVTPDSMRIYRDRYSHPREASVELVGKYGLGRLFNSHIENAEPDSERSFERDVQAWLESLSLNSSGNDLAPELRHAIDLNILPALSQGTIRAGHPRTALSA